MTQELDIFCSTTARLYYYEACLQVENPLNVTLTLLRQTALYHKSSWYDCAFRNSSLGNSLVGIP
ncbi:hypothetical protein J6590_098782 [Homalodisca vitripennis]|nr:hypothetical protein J6590_098782 [Homalodisca vitripennis]